MMNIPIPTMLTIRETARKTGLAEHYVRKLVLEDRIQYFRAGNKYLVNQEDLIAYLDAKQKASLA